MERILKTYCLTSYDIKHNPKYSFLFEELNPLQALAGFFNKKIELKKDKKRVLNPFTALLRKHLNKKKKQKESAKKELELEKSRDSEVFEVTSKKRIMKRKWNTGTTRDKVKEQKKLQFLQQLLSLECGRVVRMKELECPIKKSAF
jgi:hypothetical protein